MKNKFKKIFLYASYSLISGNNYSRSAEQKELGEDFFYRICVDENVLIEREFLDYFKKIASVEQPIMISVKAQDVYGKRAEYESEKDFPEFSENEITNVFLSEKFEGLQSFLLTALKKYPLAVYEIKASVWVKSPEHREKISGFCSARLIRNAP